MTESDLVGELKRHLERALPGCVVFKHRDEVTAGVPDLSVTYGGTTTWLEAKLFKMSPGAVFLVDNLIAGIPEAQRLQYTTMRRLAGVGRAFYVVWVSHRKSWYHAVLEPLSSTRLLTVRHGLGKGHEYLTEFIRKRR